MCDLWQKKILKLTTSKKQNSKTGRGFEKNEIIGCVNSVYKKGVGNKVLLWQKKSK